MNPLEKIRAGIIEGNWISVCEGYKAMTGEELASPPHDVLTTQNLKQAIVDALKESNVLMVTGDPDPDEMHYTTPSKTNNEPLSDNDEENVEFEEVVIESNKQGYYGNKSVLITDTPTEERIMEAEEWKKTHKQGRQLRSAHKMFDIECSDCGKTFKNSIKAGGKFGQKCKNCLKGLARNRE